VDRPTGAGGQFQVIRVPDLFLSYSREDQAIAQRFATAFERKGFSVWWDQTLRSGEAYDEVTEKALREAKAVVVLWSRTSVVSRWVRAEATLADRNKTLVPVMIEDCERPIMFELTQTADLTRWEGTPTDRVWLALVSDVRRRVEAGSALAIPPTAATLPETPRLVTAGSAARLNILILPFINMSGDPEQEYFSDGVTEDIITDLGRVSALSVVSRNAAFALKGKTIAAAQIGREKHVSHILEGSIRKSGSRVRITAQLVEAATDAQVWAERFDRTLDDIFAIQDEISQAIVGALKVKLAPAEKKAIEQRATSSSEAYELFLLARQFSRTGSERMQPLIVRICNRIVELDPQCAQAWAQLSFAASGMAQRGQTGEQLQKAIQMAQRAIDLDPELAEAHAAMAEAVGRGPDMNLAAGRPHIEAALRLNPGCFEAQLYAGYLCLGNHEFEKAIRHFEAAVALDPNAYSPAGMVIQAYVGIGDKPKANAAARRQVALCEKLLAVEPDHSGALGAMALALAHLGEADRAREWGRRARLFDPDNIRLLYNLACGMAKMNDAEGACDVLDDVFSKVDSGYLLWLDRDNDFDSVRSHPRFVAMLARVRERYGVKRG
jgi:adenylate cyclase